jgi:hypothetical protein
MRPAGEIRQALIQAARDVVAELGLQDKGIGRGATLAELADRSCVGRDAARRCVDNMRRSGALQIVGERRVDYRNRPVAEYAPPAEDGVTVGEGWVDLGHCMADWVR